MSDEVVVGSKKLQQILANMSANVKGAALMNAVKAGGLVILNAVKSKIKSQGLIRTRTLSRSIHEEVTEIGPERVALEVGTNLEYAAIHEYGGTITAKKGKYLAIPVADFRDSPRRHRLRVRKTKNGTLVLVKSGSGQVAYVLKTSVTIPARPYMRPAFDETRDEATKDIERVFVAQIEKAVQK